MGRVLGIVVIYVLMFLAWTAAGVFLLLAPRRAENLIHENFGLFPQVQRAGVLKKAVLRLIGLGLLAFAAHFAFRAMDVVS